VKSIISRSRIAEFARFAIVGVAATVLHYAVYYVLLSWVNPSLAYTIGYAVSFVCNYVLSSLFTFRVRMSVRRAFAFMMSHILNYIIGIALLNIFILAGVNERLAPLPVFVLVVPVNFILVRFALKSKKIEKEEK
jgi:putative flippase GtrA